VEKSEGYILCWYWTTESQCAVNYHFISLVSTLRKKLGQFDLLDIWRVANDSSSEITEPFNSTRLLSKKNTHIEESTRKLEKGFFPLKLKKLMEKSNFLNLRVDSSMWVLFRTRSKLIKWVKLTDFFLILRVTWKKWRICDKRNTVLLSQWMRHYQL